MEEQPEMLVTRRSKRSTAGNRMEAALAEMALDDQNKDLDDDVDFIDDKVEEDIFGSDFESTDEEAEKVVEEAGEAEVANEERRAKKAARTRLERTTAAAHAKNKSTFNPDIQISTTRKSKPKPQAVALADDANVASTSKGNDERKRTSQRKHTVLNTSATVKRLKQSEARRASLPKKAKVETKRYTQAELIALALDNEEGNIVEHRDYLKNEAEKRKRARVVRSTVTGPLLRWTSRKEVIKVAVTPPPPPPPPVVPAIQPTSSAYRSIYGPPGSLFTPTTYSYAGGATIVSTGASTSSITPTTTAPTTIPQPTATPTSFLPYQSYMDPAYSVFPMWPPPQPYYPSATSALATTPGATITPSASTIPSSTTTSTSITTPASVTTTASATTPALTTTPQPQALTTQMPGTTVTLPNTIPPTLQSLPKPTEPAPLPEPEYREETVTKNYIIHELGQQKGTPKATWSDTMQAMFGDHVKWSEMKVFVGKGRPLSRPRQTCLITGRQAHYLDPRTGIPYANSDAYKVITGLLRHEYVWNPSIGCYVGHGGPPPEVLERDAEQDNVDDAMSVDS